VTTIISVVAAVYGATAITVAVQFWKATPQSEVDDAVERAEMQLSPMLRTATPIVTRIARPAWAIFHGALWPLVLINTYRSR